MSLTKVSAGVLNIDDLYGFRNRIINGDMRIDQRNAGASANNAGGATTYILDRWAHFGPSSDKFSIQQSSNAPTGFVNSQLITSLASTSMSASNQYLLRQPIEGYNIADLNWGSANAKTVTLSFWVRSSLTGAFGGSVTNGDVNRSYPFSYTISVANTWEQKTVTITGPTDGTWNTGNGTGLRLYFALGFGSDFNGTAGTWATVSDVTYPTGSTNILGTNGATFYITGVQLEVGSVATPFERRPYGTELALCQRYYLDAEYRTLGNSIMFNTGNSINRANQMITAVYFPTTMRTAPTISVGADDVGVGTYYTLNPNGNGRLAPSSSLATNITTSSFIARCSDDDDDTKSGFRGCFKADAEL